MIFPTQIRNGARPKPATSGAGLIAVGLAGVLASIFWPMFPIVTAVALLALGATEATIVRFQRLPAFVGVLMLNAAVYALLYCLFLGAVLHQAGLGTAGLSVMGACDLAISTVPIFIAARRIVVAVRQYSQDGGW